MKAPFLLRCLLATVAVISVSTFPAGAGESESSEMDAARKALRFDRDAKHTLIELIERKIEGQAADPETLRELGLLFADAEQWDRALDVCEQLGAFKPRPEATIREILAAIARSRGQAEDEIGHLRMLCDLAPANDEAAERLARLSLASGSFDLALEMSERALKNRPSDPSLHLLRARVLMGLDRWVEASGAVNSANRLDPESREVKELLPGFERLGTYGAETIDRLAKKRAVGRIGPEECYQAGLILSNAGFPSQSLPFFEAATKITPNAMLPRLLYGQALASLNRLDEAGALSYIANPLRELRPSDIESFRASDAKLLANPGDAAARYDRTWHLNNVGQFLLALDEASKIIEDDPRHSGALKESAYALFKLGRFKEARARLIESIAIESTRADSFALLGRIEIELAEFDAAAAALDKSLALQNNDDIRALAERVKKIIASR